MAVKKRFGEVLSRVRQAQGFATAYAFFHARDGRASLGMTFRNYVNIEHGAIVPKPEKLDALLAALGVGEHSPQAKELAQAYLEDLGLTKVARLIAGPERASDVGGQEDLQRAASKALEHKLVHLTLEQWKVTAADYDAYLCDNLLATTTDWLTLAELAKETGLSPAAAKRAAAALAKAGLAKLDKGRVRTAFGDNHIEAPPILPAWVGVNARLLENQQRFAGESALVQNAKMALRVRESDLPRIRRQLDQLIQVCALYEDQKQASDSAVYLVRAQLLKAFPRKR